VGQFCSMQEDVMPAWEAVEAADPGSLSKSAGDQSQNTWQNCMKRPVMNEKTKRSA